MYPRIDPGELCSQSHIFLDPPRLSQQVTLTTTNENKVKQKPLLNINKRS